MIGFGEYAAQLRAAAASVKPLLELTLEFEMKVLALEARELPGAGHPFWPPLAEVTEEEKARLGYGVPDPLLREGELRDGIEGGAEGSVGYLGNSDQKAVYHEIGTAKMPARPIYAYTLNHHIPRLVTVFDNLAVEIITGARRV